MEQVSGIIGIVSGLIAIYSFVTGPRGTSGRGNGLSAAPSAGRLLVPIAVFVISLAVTFAIGWGGSDSAGIMLTLLAIASISVFAYVVRLHRFVTPSAFAVASVVGLTILGYAFGFATAGEEVGGLVMGMLTGVGVPVVTRLSQRSSGVPRQDASVNHRHGSPDVDALQRKRF